LPLFAEQLEMVRSDIFDSLPDGITDQRKTIVQKLASEIFELLLEVPVIVSDLRRAIETPSTHPSVRCALLGSLAYLVQPRDLLPDDLPGCYGFVDDCIILRTTLSECFGTLSSSISGDEQEQRAIHLLAMCIPPDGTKNFQEAVDGVWNLFQKLMIMPPEQLEKASSKLLDDPLRLPLPQLDAEGSQFSPGPHLQTMVTGCKIDVKDGIVRVCFADGLIVEIDKETK